MIPNIIHFCFGLKKQTEEFYYTYYLAILSAIKINNPTIIFFYYHYEPYGQYWELIKPYLTLEKVEIPLKIGNKNLKNIAHQSDIIRLQKLYERGGVYFDIDTISYRPYINLLNNDFVMGKEYDYGLCNAIFLSKPKSIFLSIWFENYEKYFIENGWNESSVVLPKLLSDKFSKYITILDEKCFFKPSFNETNDIFVNNVDINNELITLHLWESKSIDFIKKIDKNWIKNNEHTLYGKIAKKFI